MIKLIKMHYQEVLDLAVKAVIAILNLLMKNVAKQLIWPKIYSNVNHHTCN